MMGIRLKDEKQLTRIEEMIKNGVSTSQLVKVMCPDLRHYLNLLAKQDKTVNDYESK